MVEVLVAAALLACDPASRPLIVAHRGGVDPRYPENTLAAFRHARAAGADVLELDLRASADGELVVLHDPTVDRTTDGRGPVHAQDMAALRRLDAGGGARIPTLVEVLEDTADSGIELLLDLKRAPGLDHGRLLRLATGGGLHRILFGVRSLDDRQRLIRGSQALGLPGTLRLVALVPDPGQIGAFLAAGVEAVRLWPDWLRQEPGLAAQVRQQGARVWVTAGDPSERELHWLMSLGIDALLVDRLASDPWGCEPPAVAR